MASLTNRPRSHCKPPAFDDRYLADPYCRIKDAVSAVMLIAGVLFFCAALPAPWRAALNPFATSAQEQAASAPIGEDRTYSKPIGEVRVGDRVAGRNPIRGQAENIEPDPKTWRKVSLFLRKDSGLGLWVELLRPLNWIEEYEAKVSSTILLDLEEMGAFGDAEVTAISPCPAIQPGKGTVVTGTFKHQADEDSDVVRLQLEDQIELTGVTTNHPYWSADRRDFIEVGKLRIGERVDTEYGAKRIVAITPIEHDGFLYNLETIEHVRTRLPGGIAGDVGSQLVRSEETYPS